MQTKSMSKHTNHSTNEPDNLHVNQFSSELVHRHIIYSLTLLLLLKSLLLLLLFEEAKLTNHSTYEPEILHVNRFSSELYSA